MPLLVDRYTVKGQSPAMADSPHLREISLSLSDPTRFADELRCWVMQGLDQSEHDCEFCTNATIVVLVTQLGRAVAIDNDGEATIGAMVQTRSAGDHNPHGGDVLVNVDRKAQGLTSSRRNFVEKLPKISHVWRGASWVRDALSMIALLSLLSWSSLVCFLQDYCIPDAWTKCAIFITMLMRMRCLRAFEWWLLTNNESLYEWQNRTSTTIAYVQDQRVTLACTRWHSTAAGHFTIDPHIA